MKALKYAALLLAIAAVASCQKEGTTSTSDADAEAVKFTATVVSPFTRTNPIDDATATALKTGDVVAVSADGQDEARYTLGEGNEWTPQTTKYIKWSAEALTFKAYYPAGVSNASMTAFDLPTDQSTMAKIEQADYMTYTSPAPQAKTESVGLALTRKMVRVVITPSFRDQFATGYTVDKVEVHGNTVGYADGAPKSGKTGVAAFKHTDGKFYALLSPTTADDAATFITVTMKKTADDKTETCTAKGIIAHQAGKSYAYDITFGNNTVKITDIAVTDWTEGSVIPGGNATLKLTIAYPATHTVNLANIGALTDALIETAIGNGKDLIITGVMGAVDFYTLRDWAKGILDNFGDRLFNLDLRGVTGLTALPPLAFYDGISDRAIGDLKHVDLPTTITSMGNQAFANCGSLAEFSAPNLLTAGDDTFNTCIAMKKFVAPKLNQLGNRMFILCNQIAEMHLTTPDNITLGQNVFEDAEVGKCKLFLHQNKQDGGSGTPAVAADGLTWGGVKWKNIVFVNDDGQSTSADPATKTVNLLEPGKLTDDLIKEAVGEGKDLKITGAMGATDFTTLLKWANKGFTDNEAKLLDNLDLSGVTGLTAIPDNTFSVIISEKVYCLRSVKSITLPTTVTEVGTRAFQYCLSLTTFTAPNLQTVAEEAFASCKALTTFSASELQTVGKYAFSACEALTEFTAPKLHTMGYSAFDNCYKLKDVTLSVLQTVSEMAFNSCAALTTFAAPELQTIESRAFQSCEALTTFTAPKLQTIGPSAFFDCKALTKIVAPKLTTIGDNPFYQCKMLTEMRLTAAGNITLDANAFRSFSTSTNCNLFLHQNKRNGGSGLPLAAADGRTWGGKVWKSIIFVDDNGAPVL